VRGGVRRRTETTSVTATGVELFRDEPMPIHLITPQSVDAGEWPAR
jgi:hypothetical protein